jgi:hypothetical protein
MASKRDGQNDVMKGLQKNNGGFFSKNLYPNMIKKSLNNTAKYKLTMGYDHARI